MLISINRIRVFLPFLFFLGLLFFPFTTIAQKSELSTEFHKKQRQQLREKLPTNSVAVYFSTPVRNRANDVDFEYHPDPNFYYLTGWNEPHAVLLVYNTPQTDAEGTYYEKLYVRDRDARNEMWNGKQLGVEGAQKMGLDRVVSKT
jgi:Xaa-Pro aminopeptidase